MYNGFELCEARALDDKEEYYDSEKYQIRTWDWQRPGNIIAEITQLNHIRESNPSLQSHLGIQFHPIADPAVLLFSKATTIIDHTGAIRDEIDNFILVAICLDPNKVHIPAFEAPLWRLGLADDAQVTVEDLIHDTQFTWQGKNQQVTLDPFKWPCAIWRLSSQNQSSLSGA
jgi:starch synthase (maltosyl-transferring)